MLIIKSLSKKLLVGLLLFFSCKSTKQVVKQINHLPLLGDGFYYSQNKEYTIDEYLLLKFYNKGHISELTVNEEIFKLNAKPMEYACLLDDLCKPPTIFYRVEGDSFFFKKKAWDSYEFSNLHFACKSYGDSIVAQITPVDYYDTLRTKLNQPTKPYTSTFKFKHAICDTTIFVKLPNKN